MDIDNNDCRFAGDGEGGGLDVASSSSVNLVSQDTCMHCCNEKNMHHPL